MSNRIFSGIMLTLLLTSILTLTFIIQPVKASGTIYIKADGSVEPSTAPIQRVGHVYTFTDDIYNMSIEVQKDNIELDGNGYMLQCSAEPSHLFGIHLNARKGVTITNIVISEGFIYGIYLDRSSDNKIINNTILGDVYYGIQLDWSDHNTLTNNKVMNTNDAILLEDSSYNTLFGNKVTENYWGITLLWGTKNTLKQNAMAANKHHFSVGWLWLEYYLHKVDCTNTVDGKPIYYLVNRHNETVRSDAGCVVIINSSRITVKNLKLENNSAAVSLAHTRNSLIENVTATKCGVGIELVASDYNIVTRNNLTANEGPGIVLIGGREYGWPCMHNNLTYNIVLNSSTSGIWLEDTGPNTLIGNTVAYSRAGGPQEFDGSGILVDDSHDCRVINNTVTRNKCGITLGATPALRNIVAGNNIVMNDVGLVLCDARLNMIYHNNFVENQLQQVETYFVTHSSTFDDGYPSGGNYWSDYTGNDTFSGPYQNEVGSDGVGDIEYQVGEKNIDRYPLMEPFGSPLRDLAISNVMVSTNQCRVGEPITVNVSVKNLGTIVETADVIVFLNETAVSSLLIPYIIPSETKALILNCDTIGFYAGNYVVSAYARPVPWETNTGDNTYVDGEVNLLPDVEPPTVTIFSPENKTYDTNSIPFTFQVSEPTSWVGFSLDDNVNVTIAGNTMLTGLAEGSHNVICYANDTSGNMGGSTKVCFTVELLHDIAVIDVATSKSGCLPIETVGHGTKTGVFVMVENQGAITELFNVTAYVNSSIIGQLQVILDSGEMRILTFTWNTADFSKGNYTISATAGTVLGETDTGDNTVVDGTVLVTIPGDVDGDRDVDIFDIVRMTNVYGISKPNPDYDPNCDIDDDGDIDIYDIVAACTHYGQKDP